MSKESTLLLDVGGQGCRALAVDGDGDIRFEGGHEVSTREKDERVEQDADELINALQAVAMTVHDEMARLNMPVDQAALAVQRGSIVCWDRHTGQALTPIISWRDRRGLPGMDRLADQASEIKQRTGLRFTPYGGASKIAWCLEQLDEVRQARQHKRLTCGPLGSFLLARLLLEKPVRVDDTLAQRSLLWSRERHEWDPWLLERFGIPERVLPMVAPSLDHYGTLACTKLPVPLNLLMGDQNCIPFLDGGPDPETLYINLGTGAFLLRPLSEPVNDERFQLTLLDRNHGSRWALEGSVHGAASALAWLERKQGRRIEHERMNGLRERVDAPPLFINSIDGLGSPWWCSGPEAGFVDEHDAHDFDARLLALLESIAFLIAANTDAMSERLAPPKRVVLSGGLSRSATLCSLIADLLGVPAVRLHTAEATALGLWCRLHDRALPRTAFDTVGVRQDHGLTKRYRRWLDNIQATVPSGK
ncbi:hypothetical protein IC757_08420 [Wenzhouxiangella sp. AB-CW3]|uniref:FGGY family carbohydrate kinase n=1 Tax=Wenzhouxiangella sp. AB-CW3 TaxID=2771012 RepID=UPI00168B9951|nr:FGGY family carbohydrate kinase [Wenzhouxiangella sp. AB-CW3]QOC21087.1 hypothetical protein IC757_08420 [Wenzhouxiangella sp. AB-CW3]